jgi:hypothetical protein
VVEHLPRKHEAQNSNPSTIENKQTKITIKNLFFLLLETRLKYLLSKYLLSKALGSNPNTDSPTKFIFFT